MRIEQQLNNLFLMKGIENASNGIRGLVVGVFVSKQGQQEKKSLEVIEKALIQHFVAEGHGVLNIHGTSVTHDSITSERRELVDFIPKYLYVER